jgi:hypothetical protein
MALNKDNVKNLSKLICHVSHSNGDCRHSITCTSRACLFWHPEVVATETTNPVVATETTNPEVVPAETPHAVDVATIKRNCSRELLEGETKSGAQLLGIMTCRPDGS